MHCGLCTAACPTYVETGDENDGPRGRIYLMRAVTDGRIELTAPVRRHLELCLDCRACETACPSGVQYGQLIEPFRVAIGEQLADAKGHDWFHRLVLFRLFPYPRRTSVALTPARLMQFLRVDRFLEWTGLTSLLPGPLRRMQAMLPRLRRLSRLPEFLPAIGKRRAKVALFTGCVSDVLFRGTNWATARVLQANGCDVYVPRDQVCCGAIHYHSGAAGPAVEFARQNLSAFVASDYDAVITNVAGCGAMLKDYGHLVHDGETPSAAFAGKVRDVSEFLVELGPIKPEGEVRLRATYHDACHLVHAQRIRNQPRQLLSLIPGLELAPLEESELCCGAAGTYNLTEPEMSERLAQRKITHIQNTAARAVFTANTGCLMQIGRKARELRLPLWVAHPIDVLDLSYRRKKGDKSNIQAG